MKKVAKNTTEKYVTEKFFKETFKSFEGRFESSARATAKAFADNAEITTLILKEIKAIHEENKYFRENISSLNSDGLSYNRKIDNLTARVEKLESKVQ